MASYSQGADSVLTFANMITFRHASFAIGAVLVVHVLALCFDWYWRMTWFDIPMHFFGGFAIAIWGLALYQWITSHIDLRLGKKKHAQYALLALHVTFVLGFVMIIGVAWEWYEFISDVLAVRSQSTVVLSQPGLADTMHDFVNDMVGGIAAFLLWRKSA